MSDDTYAPPTCTVPGCEHRYYGRGFCQPHYQEHKRAGTLPPRPVCSHEDCSRLAVAKGVCQMHFYADRRKPSTLMKPGGPCAIEGCPTPATVKGLCPLHYSRSLAAKRNAGKPPPLTLEERFWSKVDKTDTCWLWTGEMRGPKSWAIFYIDRKGRAARRVAYEWTIGPIPEGQYLRAKCGETRCVRPDHMRLGERRGPSTQMKSGGPCAIEGCPTPSSIKGLCQKHYGRAWRAAHPGNGPGNGPGTRGPSKLSTAVVLGIFADQRSDEEVAAEAGTTPGVIRSIRARR